MDGEVILGFLIISMISLIIGFACWIGCADIVVDVISALFNNEEPPVPRSRSTGRFRQENTGNQRNMETVFQPDTLCIFSIDFWLASRSFRQETPVNHRKKIRKFSGWNTTSISHHFLDVF
jgi:hypothetical protein